MRDLEFYVVKDENIELSNRITDQDIVIILDGKAGYIWKGNQAKNIDESSANKIVELMKKKFSDKKIDLILNLEINETDNPKIIQIKTEIAQRLPSMI